MSASIRKKILGALLAFVGIAGLDSGASEGSKSNRLRQNGLRADAVVVARRACSARDGSRAYHLDVRYQPGGGANPETRSFAVDRSVFASKADGDRVEVRYLAAEPQVVELVGSEANGAGPLMLGSAALLAGTVLICRRPRA